MSDPRTHIPPYPGLRIEEDRTVWEGRFPLQVVRFRHRRFDGDESGDRTWELWRRGRAAALVPYDPVADKVILIEQFRLPVLAAGLDPIMVEIPAGLCNPDETEDATIRRELREEIGLDADRVEKIGQFVLTPGGCDERITIFAGRVTAPATDPDGIVGLTGLAAEHEDIRVRVHDAREVIEQAAAGAYPNSVCTIGLLWLGLKREELRRTWRS
jgi:ADP-ribose pyrophosphatase